jgi:ankyrin repeat protein
VFDLHTDYGFGTPLHLAALNQHSDVVQLLRQHGGHE